MSRHEIVIDSNAFENEIPDGMSPAGDGTFLEPQPLVQHDGSIGEGYKMVNPTIGGVVNRTGMFGYQDNFPRDVVAALPGQVTRIRMKFNREGRFVWHCHVLSHEDHEMMRILHVGPMPEHLDHMGGDHDMGGAEETPEDPTDDATANDDDAADDDETAVDDDDSSPEEHHSDDDEYKSESEGRRTFFFFHDDDEYHASDDDADQRTYFYFDGSSSSDSGSDDRRNLRATAAWVWNNGARTHARTQKRKR